MLCCEQAKQTFLPKQSKTLASYGLYNHVFDAVQQRTPRFYTSQMLKFGCIWSTYWTLSLMPLMVYPKVLFHPYFSTKATLEVQTAPSCTGCPPQPLAADGGGLHDDRSQTRGAGKPPVCPGLHQHRGQLLPGDLYVENQQRDDGVSNFGPYKP